MRQFQITVQSETFSNVDFWKCLRFLSYFLKKKKISVRLLLTRMHKYTSYAYKTQHLGPEYVKVNCTISICNTNSWQTSPKSLFYVTICLHMIQLLGIKLCEVSRYNLEEKIVSILSDHSTILLCISSFGSFLDLLMYDRTAAMAAGILLMYTRKNFN